MNKLLLLVIGSVIIILAGCTTTSVSVNPSEQITKDFLEEANNQGEVYQIVNYEAEIGNGESSVIIVNTNSKEVALIEYSLTAFDTPQDFKVYEGVEYSDVGEELELFSKNRVLDTTPTSNWYVDPTITSLGQELDRHLLTGEKKVGGQIRRNTYPWVLKSNETYAIVSTNRGGNSEQVVNIAFRER